MAEGLPYYTEDPLMDEPRKEHRLLLEAVGDAPGLLGARSKRYGAACSAGDWIDPRPYDRHAHMEGFDQHMHDVQRQLHEAGAEEKGSEA